MEEQKIELKIRELKQKDVYRLSKILKKINLKDNVKGLFTDVTGKSEKEKGSIGAEVGVKFALIFVENMHLAEKEVDSFLGDLVGLKPEEYSELLFKQSIAIIKDLFAQEGIADFFHMASDQMKS